MPDSPALTTVLSSLRDWMDVRGLESGPLRDVATLKGGTQNILVRFGRGEREFVLRRPSLEPRPGGSETMRREARVLSALANTPVRHPKIIAACPTEDVMGTAFYLMEPLPGFNATVGLPALHASSAAIRRAMGYELVDALAELGKVDAVSVGLGELGKIDGFLTRQVPRWTKQLDSYREYEGWANELPGVHDVGKWLAEHCPTNFTPGILHGDYHFANVLFADDSPAITGIVDWELTTFGDPLLDLGWILCGWPESDGTGPASAMVSPWSGFPTPTELLSHYARSTVRDMSNMRWYSILACYKLGIIVEGSYARALTGKADMATGLTLHKQAIALLDRAQSWIEQRPSYFER